MISFFDSFNKFNFFTSPKKWGKCRRIGNSHRMVQDCFRKKKKTKRKVKESVVKFEFSHSDLASVSLTEEQIAAFWLPTAFDKKTVEGVTQSMKIVFLGTTPLLDKV